MKKLFLALVALLTLSACSGQDKQPEQTSLLHKSWQEVEVAARGGTVRFYMYGGWAHVNEWVDTFVAGELKERYGITLERVPMDAASFVNKLLTEKSADKEEGVIDLLWVNGENFKKLRQADALFGPYAERLPNFELYVDKELAAYDFGYPVDGYETPYGWAQFVFEYDHNRNQDIPESYAELQDWAMRHPGKFTYPQPPDFTGSAFIRQVFYATTGGSDQHLTGWNEELYARNAPKLWAYLNELKPYLWQEGRAYPKSSAELDTLFARGEVDMSMSYHPLHAQSKIIEGTYAPSVETFVMKEGSIFNLHFTAIPFNAPNKAAAMVTANFLMSPEAQLSKFDPKNWGDYPAIDVSRLSEEQQARFTGMDLGEPTLTFGALAVSAVPEIPSEYVEALERDWDTEVLHK